MFFIGLSIRIDFIGGGHMCETIVSVQELWLIMGRGHLSEEEGGLWAGFCGTLY